MGRSCCEVYFDLGSVVESSDLFDHGRAPFLVLKRWCYPASQIYKIRISGSESDIVFIKMLENRNKDEFRKHQMLIENEYNVLKIMHEMRDTEEYGVAEPLECIKEKLALITKEAQGDRLDRALLSVMPFSKDDCNEMERSMLSIGRWLRIFFETTKSEESRCDVGSVVLEEIEKHLNNLMNHTEKGEWEHLFGPLVNHARDLANSMNALALKESLCHGDFIPANILRSKTGRITVLDFSDSKRGIIYEDLARFWQWLDDLKVRRPWKKNSDIVRMKTCLIRGFFGGKVELNVLRIFLIKAYLERLSRLIGAGPRGFLGDLRKARLIDYCREKLLRVCQDQLRSDIY